MGVDDVRNAVANYALRQPVVYRMALSKCCSPMTMVRSRSGGYLLLGIRVIKAQGLSFLGRYAHFGKFAP